MEVTMFTILADAMFAATLAKRGSEIPERLKDHPDRYVAKNKRKNASAQFNFNPYRDLW
jgi:hypothetical protein